MCLPINKIVKQSVFILMFLLLISNLAAYADIKEDLKLLRDRCLYYSIGHAPNDENTITIFHGLYGQAPFPEEEDVIEIDIAASGFALAALPSAVEIGLISKDKAEMIAINASQRIVQMVESSNSASTVDEYEKYGYKGMLYHYYVWSEQDNEFHRKSGVEVTSIDTALLMYGFMICANYFHGEVWDNYIHARDLISWRDWLETSTPGHMSQFRMYYKNGAFGDVWWDFRTEETMLIILFAAMSDPALDVKKLWNAWEKEIATYTSDSKTFTCYATWNGDPFTVFYGLNFMKFRRDFNGINWFSQSKTAYHAHVEFFKKERGYLNHMTFAFSDGSEGAIAEPKINPEDPIVRKDAPIYSIAGGLDYYSRDPDSNPIAQTISLLVKNDDFFEWTGWPPESVRAKEPDHPACNPNIIGQNISSIAISIDNYLTNRVRNIVMQDDDFRRVFNIVFPVNITPAILPLILD